DQMNLAAGLGPLDDNGGSTPTQPLLLGSPAINAGNPASCVDSFGAVLTLDQRGYPRQGRCDIGAVEAQPLDGTGQTVDRVESFPGQRLPYTIGVNNAGAGAVSGIAVTDTLPVGLTYVNGSLSATGGTFAFANGVITWTGSVSAGQTVSIQYSATSAATASL